MHGGPARAAEAAVMGRTKFEIGRLGGLEVVDTKETPMAFLEETKAF